MVDIIWGSTDKPVSSRQLADKLESLSLEGTLYIGYPIIGSPEGPFPIDALFLGVKQGVVIFHLVEGRDLGNYQEIQDESYNKLLAKLLQHKQLSKARELLVKISVVTFAPAIRNVDSINSEDNSVCDQDTLEEYLTSIKWKNSDLFQALVSVIQSITTIRRNKKRRQTSNPLSRGTKLKKLEDSIANLDTHQAAAVIETFEGVQRVRGLAGSGKTIVLALKVAYLHAQHPDWLIAVTFNTRSLKGQFERFINSFTIEQTGDEPDWSKIQIIHAWGSAGGKNKDGIYYTFCRENGIEYFDFQTAKFRFGSENEFAGACEKALNDVKNYKQIYDVILIDEAQDFSPSFLVLCYELLKAPKRLIYAYDELQSLTSKALPAPEEIFRKNSDGTPRVRFLEQVRGRPKQDITLRICYRNSRPLLTTAHALGFGIYRNKGLIQMFDQKELWTEIGYIVEDGRLEEGFKVKLDRTPDTSPLFLETHSPIDDLIQFHTFESKEDQTNWLVNQIAINLREDELDPDDIIVINPDPFTTKTEVGLAREKLMRMKINSILAGVSSSPDIFYENDCVTFTGIFRAKGNEAAMVYVINADDCYTAWRGEIARVRNRLFTAITRSKAWVRVCGVGSNMKKLELEFNKLKKNDFSLEFKYPTEPERNNLNIVNRDMTASEKKKITKRRSELNAILDSIQSGETMIDDYPKDVLAKLRKLLGGDSK
jgi:superfamily I DNA and RNA helicase